MQTPKSFIPSDGINGNRQVYQPPMVQGEPVAVRPSATRPRLATDEPTLTLYRHEGLVQFNKAATHAADASNRYWRVELMEQEGRWYLIRHAHAAHPLAYQHGEPAKFRATVAVRQFFEQSRAAGPSMRCRLKPMPYQNGLAFELLPPANVENVENIL